MLRKIRSLFKKKSIRSGGLIKRKIGNHTMYLDPHDSGLSKCLTTLKKGVDREAAFMKVLRQEVEEGMLYISNVLFALYDLH